MRRITVTDKDKIGAGLFGLVFKISSTHIVKIFKPNYFKKVWPLIRDEIIGSKQMKGALPIEEIVIVNYQKHKTIGLIKRFIPYEISREELEKEKRNKNIFCFEEAGISNCRKDEKGKIWLIDTQTVNLFDLYERLRLY